MSFPNPPAYTASPESVPGFDKLPENVKAQLTEVHVLTQSPQVDDDAAKKAAEAVKKAQPKLIKAIEELGRGALEIDAAFERVRIQLGDVDSLDFKDKNGNSVQKFQPTWLEYQQRWKDLLWASRQTAIETDAYIQDFLEVILPGIESIKNDKDLEDAKKDLAAFLKRAPTSASGTPDESAGPTIHEKTIEDSKLYTDGFQKLKNDVSAYKEKILAFTESLGDIEKDLNGKIAAEQKIIDDAQAEISSLDTTITALASKLEAISVCTGVGAMIGFIFCPLYSLAILGAGLIYLSITAKELDDVKTHRAELVKTRDAAKSRKGEYEKKLEDLKNIRATLQAQADGDIALIAAKLSCLEKIWIMVHEEATRIHTQLKEVSAREATQKAFLSRIAIIKQNYINFSAALSLYATNTELEQVMNVDEPEE
ncbi:hypothetical protein CC1G_11128 [Coprinopsis cinerea okayama7|uniref:Uncharacterized protein n=1 Tax=Coprinopsis cinerea (strain Okayama-7 / 130 / ATCC MYA-4618 / FGSC 9003) TaxID=240176 RepID=A8N4R3_COPC7|nr:hypothetical protein CC1G_11128 [Coprinopsis cinerea okayama7\|eukprot:XP_001829858.2 hypothetical protein CC1G_11128 [Coprinopsis cinerea okayama7\